MFKKNSFILVFLLCIFLLALVLRFYKLSEFPVGFHIDEASLGYNGYSILHTGKDDNGNRYPLYIDMFGDNRPSGYHYLTILPIIFFGLSEFSTRFPAAFFGAFSIFALYFLTFAIFENKKLSLLSALLLAIAPWHIVLSRASVEAVISIFFIILGFGFIFLGIRKLRQSYLYLGGFLLSLSYFFYHTPRVFVPMFYFSFLVLMIIFRKEFKKKILYGVFIVFFYLVSVSALLVLSVPGGTGRFTQVNIFNSFETDFQLTQQAIEDRVGGGNPIIFKVLHNKITNVSLIFVANYLDYFSGEFLFTKGGLPNWYSIPRIGLLYLFELPFVLFGIIYLINSKNRFHKIPLLWLLVAPIVAAITNDDIPNINRASVMFPMFHIISAYGIIHFFEIARGNKKKLAIFFFVLFLFLNTAYFLQQYFVNAKAHNPWYRNNGFSEMMDIVKNEYDQYDKIILSKYQGGIYPLVLFYLQYDPRTYQAEGSPKNQDYKGFGKIVFVPQDCPSVQSSVQLQKLGNAMYIDKGDCPYDKTLAFRKHSFVYREDGTKAFRIVYE